MMKRRHLTSFLRRCFGRFPAALARIATCLAAILATGTDTSLGQPVDGQPIAEFNLRYVPPHALGAIALRPAELLAQPAYAALAETFWNDMKKDVKSKWGLQLHEIEEIVFVFDHPPSLMGVRRVVVRTSHPHDWAVHLKARSERQRIRLWSFAVLDDRTAAIGPVYFPVHAQERHKQRGPAPIWEDAWRRHPDAVASIAVNVRTFRPLFDVLPEEWRLLLAALEPAVGHCEYLVGSLLLQDGVRTMIALQADGAAGAAEVNRTVAEELSAARTFLRDSEFFPDATPEAQLVETAAELLDQAEISTTAEHQIQIRFALDRETAARTTPLAQAAIRHAGAKARRKDSIERLERIARAMLRYHRHHLRFPPSVVYSESGVPRSWRIELLPFIKHQALADQYDRDQPWDSAANRLVTDQVLEVFKSPYADPADNSTNYFVVGWPEKNGWSLFPHGDVRSVDDDVRHTIMIVESAKDVPWAKPEDIPYDGEGEPPKIDGLVDGGFQAATFDGEVHFIPESIDDPTLRRLFLPDDGEKAEIPNAVQ